MISQLPAPLIYALGIAFSKGLSLVTLPILARGLGPELYGQLDLLVLLMEFVGIFIGFGVVEATQRYLANTEEILASEVLGTAVGTFLVILAILHVVISGIGWALCFWEVFNFPFLYVYLAIVAATFSALLTLPLMVFRYRNFAYSYVFAGLSLATLQAIGSVISVLMGFGILGILVSSVFSNGMVASYLSVKIVRKNPIKIDLDMAKPLLTYGFPVAVSGIAAFCYNGLERWWLSETISPEALGNYSATWKVALMVTLATQAFQLWWSPQRLILISQSQLEKVASYASYGVCWLISCTIFVALFSSEIYSFLFGKSFVLDDKLLFLLLAVVVLRVAADLINVGCFVGESTNVQMLIQISSAIITVVFLYLFVPLFGVYGAIVSLFVGACLRLVLFFSYSQKNIYINYPFGRLFGFMLLALLLGGGMFEAFTSETSAILMVKFVIFWLSVASCFFLLFIFPRSGIESWPKLSRLKRVL